MTFITVSLLSKYSFYQ